ncbi:AraC family transcriptional regulator [Bacillus sp. SD088]|uniref:AraC family transcriptional regulator n=1 Tax=Bacillus sp. SD088 TaxID=2782012 RepID=UPI001A974724|nr:AraC family transcriptional regulator [Bacillus sp. SD088]MBO0993240.1 helix-turn-helix transcriptional regulator [Bacillus sp. SD088]
MLSLHSVNNDCFIPNWQTPLEKIPWNVLVIVLEGKVDYMINNKRLILEPGDIMFIPESSYRTGKNHNHTLHQKYTVLFHLTKDMRDIPEFLTMEDFTKLQSKNFNYIKHRAEKLFMEIRGNNTCNTFICDGILQELLGSIGRELQSSQVNPMKLKYAQTIQRYIVEHYREAIDINQLAKLIHRSPNYTIEVFKEITGYTPIQYIHHLRIMEGCSLLLATDMTIDNLSNYLGYYDASYFSRTFKKFISMSPKEYRNQESTVSSSEFV